MAGFKACAKPAKRLGDESRHQSTEHSEWGHGMEILIWLGAGLTLLGVLGLVWCIVLAMRARKSGLPDDQVKAALQRVVALNLGALAVSAIGLMMVVMGVILG